MPISKGLRDQVLGYQRNEITEHHIYRRLAQPIKSPENRRILSQIAAYELGHYRQWKNHTEQDVEPDRWKVWRFCLIGRHHCRIQLLHLGRQRRVVQAAISRDGGFESWRRRAEFCRRPFDTRVSGYRDLKRALHCPHLKTLTKEMQTQLQTTPKAEKTTQGGWPIE